MGDADINMGGVEPLRPLLPYNVLYPPELPDKINYRNQGQIHERDPDWSRDARYFGARDDGLFGEGFEVRPWNYKDLSLKGKYHSDDWDVQYRLGPPSELPWSDVITKWGLQVLNKAGFLNLDLGFPESMMGIQGRYLPKRPTAWKDEAVHPVFRQDMFFTTNKTAISDAEYSLLKPAILLASAMLDDPTTMCIFHALATPSCQVVVEDKVLQGCKRLQVPDSLTEAEQASVFQKLCDMRKWTHFYWEDLETLDKAGALAWTCPIPKTTASHMFTRQSKIGLSRLYVEALFLWRTRGSRKHYPDFIKNIINTARVPPSHIPEGFEEHLDSAPIRTCFILALILIHELSHAFAMAYFGLPQVNVPTEPWVGDSRDNEFGHAVVRHILGGIPYACSFSPPAGVPTGRKWRVYAYAPFGIFINEKYSPWANPGERKQHLTKGVLEDFTSPIVSFPLPQRQLHDYSSADFWSQEVSRNGLGALKVAKIPEWAAYRMPGPNRVKPAEGNTLR